MNEVTTISKVVDYLEELCQGNEKIDSSKISQITAIPFALFQRIFTFVTGISMADYVRKRKLSHAFLDIQNTDHTFLDIAVKYGFESHSAFSRAFKNQFDLTPTDVRNGCHPVMLYPPLEFNDIRIIGGKKIMAKVEKILYREVEARLFVGQKSDTDFHHAGQLWGAFYTSPECQLLSELPETERDCDDLEDCVGIGCMFDFIDDMHFSLMIGDFFKSNAPRHPKLAYKLLPKGKIAEVRIEGNDVADILDSAYFLITEAIEKTNHKIDMDHFYWCEIYTLERYAKKLEQHQKVQIDYLVPVLEQTS